MEKIRSFVFATLTRLCVVAGTCYFALACSSALAQMPGDVQCTYANNPLTVVRAEGIAELAGDLLLTCTGGTAGQTLPIDFTLRADRRITSRLVAPVQSEAVMIFDELQGAYGTKHMATPGTDGVSLLWPEVPFVAPGPAATRTIRITNVRVSIASPWAERVTFDFSARFYSAIFTPWNVVIRGSRVVALVERASSHSIRNCSGGSPTHAPATPGTMQHSIHFSERSENLFKPRSAANESTQPPGTVYTTESGLMHPSLPAEAGLADAGTRLMVRFTDVPSGARVFVTIEPSAHTASIGAKLVPADENGAVPISGGTAPLPATTSLTCPDAGGPFPAAEVPVLNGSATAVWEVTSASPTSLESIGFGFSVVVPGADRYLPTIGAGLAPAYPQGTVDSMSQTLPIPRFLAFASGSRPQIIWLRQAGGDATAWHFAGIRKQLVRQWEWVTRGMLGQNFVAAADLDHDGVTDLVTQAASTRKVIVIYGPYSNSSLRSAYIHPEGAPGWSVVAAADFNRDGNPDIVWQNDVTRQVTVWYMGGVGGNINTGWSWLHSTGAAGWKVIAAADMNHDGTADLIWQKDDTRQATVWYMGSAQGNQLLTWAWIHSGGAQGWRIAAAADIDRDGNSDLIWQQDGTGYATVWYMGGSDGSINTAWEWINNSPAPGWTIVCGN